MNDLNVRIKQLPEVEFPAGLHQRIMKKVLFMQFGASLITVAVLLSINSFISIWHLWVRIGSLDTIAAFKTLFDGFEISEDFFLSLINTVRDDFPVSLMIMALVNLILLAYVIFVFLQTRKIIKGRTIELK